MTFSIGAPGVAVGTFFGVEYRRGSERMIESKDLSIGDRINAKSRGCKCVLKNAEAAVKLFVSHVKVKAAHPPEEVEKTEGAEKTGEDNKTDASGEGMDAS